MSIVGDIIAGFGLAIALVAVIISIVRTRKIGPILSIFDFKEKKIRTKFIEDREDFLVGDKFPKPKWFIEVGYEVLNTGDLTSKFTYYATLTLHDILDKQTNKPMKTKSVNTVVDIFEPGKWKVELSVRHIRSFAFEFDDIEAHKWEFATIEIKGHFYDKKSTKKPIQIEPRKLKNPQHPQELSKADEDKIKAYNEQKIKLVSKDI